MSDQLGPKDYGTIQVCPHCSLWVRYGDGLRHFMANCAVCGLVEVENFAPTREHHE